MEKLVQQLTKANEAYRNGLSLTMTDEEYDAGLEELAKKVPNHPFLKNSLARNLPSFLVKTLERGHCISPYISNLIVEKVLKISHC